MAKTKQVFESRYTTIYRDRNAFVVGAKAAKGHCKVSYSFGWAFFVACLIDIDLGDVREEDLK